MRPDDQTPHAHAGPVLLYDGTCAFCAATVQFVLRHERRHTLRFASLDGEFGRAVIAAHPALADDDSIIWYDPRPAEGAAAVLTRSAAVVRVARYLGGPWHAARVLMALPRGVRDAAYRVLAAHRHRLMRPDDACVIPTPATAARFLR